MVLKNLIKIRRSTSPGFLQQSVWISLSRWGVASKPFEGSSQLCRGEPSKLFLEERKIWALLQFHVFLCWLFDFNFFRQVFNFNFSGCFSFSTFFRLVFNFNFSQAGFQFQLFFRQVFNWNFFRQVFNWPQWCLGRSTRSLGSPGSGGEKTQSPVLRGRLTEAAKKLAVRKILFESQFYLFWKFWSDPGKFKHIEKTDNSLGP